MIQEDIKDFIEYHFNDVKAYPNVIPQGECLPAIMYRFTNDSRDSDSVLDGEDVATVDLQAIIVSKSYKKTSEMAKILREAFSNFNGIIVQTNVLIGRVTNGQDLYNPTQQTHEHTLNINLKIRR